MRNWKVVENDEDNDCWYGLVLDSYTDDYIIKLVESKNNGIYIIVSDFFDIEYDEIETENLEEAKEICEDILKDIVYDRIDPLERILSELEEE